MNRCILILLFILTANISACLAQQTVVIDGLTIPSTRIIDGKLVPNWLIPEIVVFPTRTFKTNRDYRQYQKIIRNIKIVYPYARIARIKLSEMNEQLQLLTAKRDKEEFINQAEKEIREQFEGQLTQLTVSQGKLLIKLIDRETGKTSYELVRELKGKFSAGFWQAIARIFGSNLKAEFDSEGEDKMLNELIVLYEHNQL
ncbi:MAG: DUF4294 domain-containing protein [Bacteroidales bacterium]|nr:DUF4294 domain-containing protein [Bacteroidales bacterium]